MELVILIVLGIADGNDDFMMEMITSLEAVMWIEKVAFLLFFLELPMEKKI